MIVNTLEGKTRCDQLHTVQTSTTDTPPGRLDEVGGGAEWWTSGIVSRAQKKTHASGGVLLAFRLEDANGSVECCAWPGTYEQFKDLLVEDGIVRLRGRVERRSEGETMLIAHEVEEHPDPELFQSHLETIWRRAILPTSSTIPSEPVDNDGLPVDRSAHDLRLMPSNVVGVERTLAQAPVHAATTRPTDDESTAHMTGSLHGRPFFFRGPVDRLSFRCLALVGYIVRRYADRGFPSDRRLRFTLGELARAVYGNNIGGKQLQSTRRCLFDLKSVSFREFRIEDGIPTEVHWGVFDESRIRLRGEGHCVITISDELVKRVRAGELVYIDLDKFLDLRGRSARAAQLWVLVRAQSVSSKLFRLRVFSAPPGEEATPSDLPAIADHLNIGHWKNRQDVVKAIRKDVAEVLKVEPDWTLAIEHGARTGTWNLIYRRTKDRTIDPEDRVLSTPTGVYIQPQQGCTSHPTSSLALPTVLPALNTYSNTFTASPPSEHLSSTEREERKGQSNSTLTTSSSVSESNSTGEACAQEFEALLAHTLAIYDQRNSDCEEA